MVFMQTDRIGFSTWRPDDLPLAQLLWGDPRVTKYICAGGRFDTAKLFVGHHPHNAASQKVLLKLGFQYLSDRFYEPTGLYHPSYEMKRNN